MLSVLFSPSMTYGWYTTCGFWSFLEVCMKPICLEEFRWRLRTFSWRTTFCENVFLEMNLELVLTRMTFVLANTISKQLYFKLVLHVNGLRSLWMRTFIFWTGVCGWLECICNMCKCMLMVTTFCCWEFVFSGEEMHYCMPGSSMCTTEWKSPMTATATSTVASSQTSFFACFRVAWKRSKSEANS